MPHSGCRAIEACFNRRFAQSKKMTVGKSFVGYTIKNHLYEIQMLRRDIKKLKPKPVPKNLIWGLDLTGKSDSSGKVHNILGIVEHHSRGCFCLMGLKDKASITLLRCLLDSIEKYGKPKLIRTDNEAVFTSRLFCFGLKVLGIRHQKTDKGCPWMNGRIERFFGTLKSRLNCWEVDNLAQLNGALGEFKIWYNHVRPHQNLGGRTPAEVWQGIDIYTNKSKQEYWFEAWDGLLTGFYFRL